jgi:hypothetical protein
MTAHPGLASLEHYHWRGYSVETISDQSNVLTCLHRGNFPMHRRCRGVDIGCTPFSLMEARLWVHREKWNIVWTDDETWLPAEQSVIMRAHLPHGFSKVLIYGKSPFLVGKSSFLVGKSPFLVGKS